MSDLYNKIVGDRGTLEDLASKIPGFRGYMEMSARRDADRMIREFVAGRIKTQIDRFASIESDIVSSLGIGFMDKTKQTKTRIEVLRRRVATDTPGYSGFFASSKIGADELEKVYAFDDAMIRYTDAFAENLDTLAEAVSSGEGIGEALTALDATAMEAGQAYDLRDDVLKDLA